MTNLTLTPTERDVVADALRDYAEGCDDYEADPDELAKVAAYGIVARDVLARIDTPEGGDTR